MRISTAFRLALRLTRPKSVNEVARAVSVVLITALLTALSLGALAAQAVVTAQHETETSRTPIGGSGGLPKVGTFTDRWAGLEITRVVLEVNKGDSPPEGPHPPGIDRLPAAGESFVSPAMRSLIRTSDVLRTSVSRTSIVGEIGESGLTDPGELRVITAVSSADASGTLTPVASFGGPNAAVGSPAALNFYVPFALTLCFVPLLMALVLANRLLAVEAARRYALFHATGLRLSHCRLMAATELAPASALGALGGWASFEFVTQHLTQVPGTSLRYWTADADIATRAVIVVALGVAALTPVISGMSTVRRPEAATRPVVKRRSAHWSWTIPFIAGLCILAVSLWVVPDQDPRRKTWGVGAAGALIVGTPLLLHVSTQSLARRLRRGARTGGMLLGSSWLGLRSSASFRLASLLAVALMTLGLSAPYAALLQGDIAPGEEALEKARGYNLLVSAVPPTFVDFEGLNPVRKVIPYFSLRDANGTTVFGLAASCSDLDAVLTDVRGCNDNEATQWLNPYEGDADSYVEGVEGPLQAATRVSETLPTTTINASIGAAFLGAIRMDPSAVRPPVPEGYLVNLTDSGPTLDQFQSELAALAPAAQVGNDYQDLIDQANSLSTFIEVLRFILLLGSAGLLIGFLVTMIKLRDERGPIVRRLAELGATSRDRRVSHLVSQFVPLLLCAGLVGSTVAAFWWATAQFDPRMRVPWTALLSTGAVVLPAIGLATFMAWPFLDRADRT